MCDRGLHFCYCLSCVNQNKIKTQNLFLKCVAEYVGIGPPEQYPKGSEICAKTMDALIQQTDLVYILPRKHIMAHFSAMIDAHPLITYKEAMETVFINELDPIIRLRFDPEYRKRFVIIFNTS